MAVKKKKLAGSITRGENNSSVVKSEDCAVSPKSRWDFEGKKGEMKNFLADLHSDLLNMTPRLELKPSTLAFSAGRHRRTACFCTSTPAQRNNNLPPTFHRHPLCQAANYHEKKHSRQSPSIYFGPREPALSTHLSICRSSPLPSFLPSPRLIRLGRCWRD